MKKKDDDLMELYKAVVLTIIAVVLVISLAHLSQCFDILIDIRSTISSLNVENTSYITTPQVIINDGKWDVAETTD